MTTTAIADDEELLPAEEIARLQHTCTERNGHWLVLASSAEHWRYLARANRHPVTLGRVVASPTR